MNRRLERALRRLGATREEIETARREGWLALLTADKLLMPGRAEYDLTEVARRAGTDVASAARLWRALGFPDLPPDDPVFTRGALKALDQLERRMEGDILRGEGDPLDGLVEQIRVLSSAQARVAEIITDQLLAAIRSGAAAGISDEEVALAVLDGLEWDRLTELYDFGLRLQTRAALWRRMAVQDDRADDAVLLAVGFVDLVGYTALSQEIDNAELAGLVGRFEQVAYDTVAEHGGRVVKMIGDEVMYVADAPAAGARIARRLIERSTVDPRLPEARAGLAFGGVLAREGDYYGPVVNLANRLVELARPGAVVASDEIHVALADEPGFTWKRLRSRRLRDIGRVEVWLLADAG